MMAIQFLKEDRDPKSNNMKKYSAVLVLKEFCKKLSIVTFNRIFDQNRNVELIFDALKDHRIHVRQTAADCINACISLINKRDYSNEQKKMYLNVIYGQIQQALYADSDANYQQSALSILSELIQIKSGGGSSQ